MRNILIMLLMSGLLKAQTVEWETIDIGFDIGVYQMPRASPFGNGELTIVRVDPNKFQFEIMHSIPGHTAEQWSKLFGFILVVNAGMYDDNGNNLGYMRNYVDVWNKKLNEDNNMLALNSNSDNISNAKILDIKAGEWFAYGRNYNSFTQSIRMIDQHGNNVWRQNDRIWSVVVVATDVLGNILFMHCRSPYTMHDFIDMILASPLGVNRMMYLEGGPPASLYADHCGRRLELIGGYESTFFENDNNKQFWRLPNVIGILKK